MGILVGETNMETKGAFQISFHVQVILKRPLKKRRRRTRAFKVESVKALDT